MPPSGFCKVGRSQGGGLLQRRFGEYLHPGIGECRLALDPAKVRLDQINRRDMPAAQRGELLGDLGEQN